MPSRPYSQYFDLPGLAVGVSVLGLGVIGYSIDVIRIDVSWAGGALVWGGTSQGDLLPDTQIFNPFQFLSGSPATDAYNATPILSLLNGESLQVNNLGAGPSDFRAQVWWRYQRSRTP